MRPQTAALAARLAGTKDLFERIEILKNAYRGETLFVIACGPSLADIPLDKLTAFLDDKLVVSIKQAYLKLPLQTDFHVIHHSNLLRYRYPRENPPIVVNEDEGHSFLHADLILPKLASNLQASLSVFRNFDEYLLDVNPVRPCGPGVMYEMVFYLAVLLGVRRIVVAGWDLYSDPEQLTQLTAGAVGQTHFYETDWRNFERDARAAEARTLPETLESYRRGELVNHHGHIDPEDIVFTALATRPFAEWLHRRGIELFVTADSPNVSRAIPRVDLFRAGDPAYLDAVAASHAEVAVPTPEFPHFQALRRPGADIAPGDPRMSVGWHRLEHWDGVPSRWSGPDRSSYLLLPLLRGRTLRVVLECIPAPNGRPPEVYADGRLLALEWSQPGGVFRGEGLLRAGEGWNEVYTLIELRVASMFQPSRDIAGSNDGRLLGFAFRSLSLRPVEG